jgi:hypothetical protein
MITISASEGSACKVQTGAGTTFFVFPEKLDKESWAMLSHPQEILESKKIFSWPGEYDFGGVTVRGVGQEQGRQVSFSCSVENVRLAFVDAPVLDWTDSEIEKLGDVDVLVIGADNPKKITTLVEAVDPRIVVLFEVKNGDLAGCAKACGQASVQPTSEVKVKPGSLPSDSRQVMVLK